MALNIDQILSTREGGGFMINLGDVLEKSEDSSFTIYIYNNNKETAYTFAPVIKKLTNGKKFDINKIYHITFTVDKDEQKNLEPYSLALVDTENWDFNPKERDKHMQRINPLLVSVEAKKMSYTFQPSLDNYNAIAFYYDKYTNKPIMIEDVSLYEVTNLLKAKEGEEPIDIKSFGIQGKPGLPFTVNGNNFVLGRTGTFYLEEEDFNITSIGVCVVDDNLANNPFIIDYTYGK